MKNDDDKLYGEIFGDDDESNPPAPKSPVAVKAKVAVPPVAPEKQVTEEDVNDAARLFQEMMADTRKASAAAKKAQPPPPPPPEPLMVRQAVPLVEEKPKASFGESVAPWTLFKGVNALAMAVYIVGFHGRLLRDAWPALAVITLGLTCLVLIVDYLRVAAQNADSEPKKKRVK